MPNDIDYDKSSVDSIVAFARRLTGHSLGDRVQIPDALIKGSNKGNLGDLVEKYYFKIKPPNDKVPDFPEAGLELKTTGVNKNKQGGYLAKERLVLSQINPRTIRSETWSDSSLLAKCQLMLILFYLYEKEIPVHKRRFELEPMLLRILDLPLSDLNQIAKDWNYIREQCAQNKFHELSEGHTTYLKACRKGSGGENEKLRKQDEGEPEAKSRAFAFPVGFMSNLVRQHTVGGVSMLSAEGQTVEDAAKIRLSDYFGKTFDEIASSIDFTNSSKSRNHALVKTLLTGQNKEPVEIKKAEIKLKTVTLAPSGIPRENLPFDVFEPLKLVDETWDDSEAILDLQTRYLFAVFQQTSKGLIFKTAGFWTMSNTDILSCRKVWEETQRRYRERIYDLPKMSEDPILFVNTHGRNSSDCIEALGGDMVTKRSFWLSKHYFAGTILPGLTW